MEHEQRRLIPLPTPEIESEQFVLAEDAFENRIKRFSVIAAKHGSTEVIVGEVVSTWEDYINLRLYAVLESPIQTDEFTGTNRAECFISATSLSELSSLTTCIYAGRTVVADKESKVIIAAHYFY